MFGEVEDIYKKVMTKAEEMYQDMKTEISSKHDTQMLVMSQYQVPQHRSSINKLVAQLQPRPKLGIHMHVCVCGYGKYQNPKINRKDILIYG